MTLLERIQASVQAATTRGYSIKNIADACGITDKAVYAWRSGDSKSIDGNNLVELAELSGFNPMWIMKGKGQKLNISSNVKLARAQQTLSTMEDAQLDLANKILNSLIESTDDSANTINKK